MNPATLAKAMRVRDYLKTHNIKPLVIFEDIKDKEDGTAVYVFQAKFADRQAAEIFKLSAELAAEMEKELAAA